MENDKFVENRKRKRTSLDGQNPTHTNTTTEEEKEILDKQKEILGSV